MVLKLGEPIAEIYLYRKGFQNVLYYVMEFMGSSFLGRMCPKEEKWPARLYVSKGPPEPTELGFHDCNMELVGFAGGKRVKLVGIMDKLVDVTECGPGMDILSFMIFRYGIESLI